PPNGSLSQRRSCQGSMRRRRALVPARLLTGLISAALRPRLARAWTVHPRPVMAAMRGREDRREDDECRQGEGPKAEVLAKRPKPPFGTMGQVQDEVAGD